MYQLSLANLFFTLFFMLPQTPVADWQAMGLNLCNSLSKKDISRLYAFARGPLFGAQAPARRRVYTPKRTGAQRFPHLAEITGVPSGFGPPEGWPTTSIPSLEERLDDHQPTGAWE